MADNVSGIPPVFLRDALDEPAPPDPPEAEPERDDDDDRDAELEHGPDHG